MSTNITDKLSLIDDLSSPLFRLMWVHGHQDPATRSFENNICAFHIGNGYLLSVAHNLRSEAAFIRVMDASVFQHELLPFLNADQKALVQSLYVYHPARGVYHLPHGLQPAAAQQLAEVFKTLSFDRRWIQLTHRNIAKPFLLVQFRESSFFGNEMLTRSFTADQYLYEPAINRHTYLLPVELVKAWYNEDLALYKLSSASQNLLASIPSISVSASVLDEDVPLYCLQSAPQNELGRMLNKATIEGYLDQASFFPDRIGGTYMMEGRRYLIRGYFRFGSSGAPYVYLHPTENRYMVNAIQSEASPIQLSINNNREGNYQYVSAIATPLGNIAEELKVLTGLSIYP